VIAPPFQQQHPLHRSMKVEKNQKKKKEKKPRKMAVVPMEGNADKHCEQMALCSI